MKSNIATITILIVVSFSSYGQLPINDSGKVAFSDVVQVEGTKKEEIYDKAKLWIVSTLKSGDNMVELEGGAIR